MAKAQADRWLAVGTSLDDDVLLLRGFSGSERLSRLFEFHLDLLSEKRDVKFEDLIGKAITVRMQTPAGDTRYFSGLISRFTQVSAGPGTLSVYRATVVPWLWFLTRHADCRIFQNLSVPDIIKQIFNQRGYGEFKVDLKQTYGPWEYCVQYRESDFNFVSRLMEQEGIYYYFTHEDGKHTLVLTDDPTSHAAFPGYATFKFSSQGADTDRGERVREWIVEKEAVSGSFTLADFDFKNPQNPLISKVADPRDHANPAGEIFDYPGEFNASEDGDTYARIRKEEMHARYETVSAATDVRGVAPGSTFALQNHPRDDQDRDYLVIGASYTASSDEFGSSDEGGGEEEFSCHFEAIPSTQPFRAARVTPKPIVQGPQTAIVVGKAGEEIWTDDQGRVKVMFHWDRDAQADENSSCWIRVAQVWAGKQWGGVFLPRIGQEVIVEFLEGDPDQPIITGRVYNGVNKPPYDLPANATLSGLKSMSSKGGGGFNEIRFQDKKGEEQVFINAQKNMDTRAANDVFEFVGHDRNLIVKNDQLEKVENDRHETVTRDHMEEIGRDRHLNVKGKEALAVAGTLSLKVGDDVTEEFGKNHSTQVTKDLYIKADNIVLEAATNLTIKVGKNFIAIESSGITVGTQEAQGKIELKAAGDLTGEAEMKASIKAGTQLGLEGSAQAELKSPATSVKGDGTVQVQGGMVKIN